MLNSLVIKLCFWSVFHRSQSIVFSVNVHDSDEISGHLNLLITSDNLSHAVIVNCGPRLDFVVVIVIITTSCQCIVVIVITIARLDLPFWYRLTRVVADKRPLNGCVCTNLLLLFITVTVTARGVYASVTCPSVCLSVCPIFGRSSNSNSLRKLKADICRLQKKKKQYSVIRESGVVTVTSIAAA